MSHYFDHNATTPLCDAAREAWLKASASHWHNASSLYREAGFTAQKLDAARERLATLLGCEADRIVFTSGATEANNALFASLRKDTTVIISAIEHPSVRAAARYWLGADRVVEVPVDEHGIVSPNRLETLTIAHRPALVSILAVSNESGALQPWNELREVCHRHGVCFHTDATQWIGKLPADQLGLCDYASGSAHKFMGPKGCGFLMLRDADETLSLLHGGLQESGHRAGTENYPSIEAMVAALEHVTTLNEAAATLQAALLNAFEYQMKAAMPGLRIISEGADRLWNTSMMVMPRHENLKWLTRLSRIGFDISTGSACSVGKEGSAVVVRALGASDAELRRVVRVSSGWHTTPEAWAELSAAFVKVMAELDAGGRPTQ